MYRQQDKEVSANLDVAINEGRQETRGQGSQLTSTELTVESIKKD